MRAICIGLLCAAAMQLHAADGVPRDATYRDPHAPVEARVQDLLSRMTLPESWRRCT